jgi:hypothetical protein
MKITLREPPWPSMNTMIARFAELRTALVLASRPVEIYRWLDTEAHAKGTTWT